MVDNFVYQTALCKVEGVDAYQFSGWRGGGVGRYNLTDHQLGRFHTVQTLPDISPPKPRSARHPGSHKVTFLFEI